MRRTSRRWLMVAASVPLGTLMLAALVYAAWRHEPAFYGNALAADSNAQIQASNELIEQASALLNDARQQGDWHALFTAEQVNGWLAVDVPKNHPRLFPPEMQAPRVALERGKIIVACRGGSGAMTAVVSLEVEPYLLAPNELAVRIRRARGGWLPLPLAPLLDQITRVATDANLPLRWDQAGGDPVAVFTIRPERSDRRQLSIESLAVKAGELYIAGQTRAADWPSASPLPRDADVPTALEARLPDAENEIER